LFILVNVFKIVDTSKPFHANIASGTTDPLGSRKTNSKFIMTSYGERPVDYPVVVLSDAAINSTPLGQQSEAMAVGMTFRLDILAKKVGAGSDSRDWVWDDVYNALRTNQRGVSPQSGTQSHGLHNFRLLNTFNLDEPGPKGLHRKIATISYDYYTS